MITNERFKTLFLNLWDYNTNDGSCLDDIVELAQCIGMKRSEFMELLAETNYISREGWTPEDNERKRNTENVNIGDTDQAILETALTQIGIPYSWEASHDGDGGWIDLKVDDKEGSIATAAEIYFTKEGKYNGAF